MSFRRFPYRQSVSLDIAAQLFEIFISSRTETGSIYRSLARVKLRTMNILPTIESR